MVKKNGSDHLSELGTHEVDKSSQLTTSKRWYGRGVRETSHTFTGTSGIEPPCEALAAYTSRLPFCNGSFS